MDKIQYAILVELAEWTRMAAEEFYSEGSESIAVVSDRIDNLAASLRYAAREWD